MDDLRELDVKIIIRPSVCEGARNGRDGYMAYLDLSAWGDTPGDAKTNLLARTRAAVRALEGSGEK